MRRREFIAALALVVLGAPTPIGAAEAQVDLQLVLAVDASGSVNMYRFELQKKGYAAAFRNPRVLAAIRSGTFQAIAVTMHQWTSPRLQVLTVPWMVVKDETSAEKLALNAFRAGDINHLVPCKPASATDAKCRDQFVRSFGLHAFRRPLRDAEFKRYAAAFTARLSSVPH